ncbi:MAG: glycosyltransferase 87 family protein [Tepidiformaceae bacterium]
MADALSEDTHPMVPTTPPRGAWVPSILRAHPLAAIIAAGLAVRIALLPLTARLPNNLTDEGFWKYWMSIIDREGVLNIFRASDTDYVGYHWVLWLLSTVYDVMGGPYTNDDFSLHILVKIPPILFDVALILTVFAATRILLRQNGFEDSRARTFALIAAGIIAFQPAALYDSAVWGQTDSAITAAMLGSLALAAINRPFSAGAVIALGMAVKPHPIIVGPVLLILLWRAGGLRAIAQATAGGVVVAGVVLGPWILHGELIRILEVYKLLFTQERQQLSELAWNFWFIFDQQGDPRPYEPIGSWYPFTWKATAFVISAVSAALAIAYAWLRPGFRDALVAAAYISFAFYGWPIGAHERYLYPFLALLLPVALLERRWIWLYAAVSTTFSLNLVTVAPPRHEWMGRWAFGDFSVAVAGLNTLLFLMFTWMLLTRLRTRREALPTHGVTLPSRPQEAPGVGAV